MNILVTGSDGQVGSEIKDLILNYKYSKLDDKYFFTNKKNLNITKKEDIKTFCDRNKINVIINCAAYTLVDKAQSDIENADKVNHLAVKYLASIAKENDIKLIHISTDYVFDGTNHKPYKESDKTCANNVYGKTKLDGENALKEINPKDSIIIRTSWVYSSFGGNFVKTMLRLGKEKSELGVIYDQIGTPTYARDLAKMILCIMLKIQNLKVEIYHYSGEGAISWYDFAKEIMKMAKLNCTINPIESKEYPLPAKRPFYSLLNKTKIKQKFKIKIPYWKDSLDECLQKLGERK